ncbi:hypothetical protein [Rhizobium leguminosarum]|uniref:hypothetical protein n=1 Tax=Rhizobium leguminosarum TaxID=384 RepID=UPI003F9E8169
MDIEKARQEKWREKYWPTKKPKTFRVWAGRAKRRHKRGLGHISQLVAVIISAAAAGIALQQTFILQDQLVAADRNKALQAAVESISNFCAAIIKARWDIADAKIPRPVNVKDEQSMKAIETAWKPAVEHLQTALFQLALMKIYLPRSTRSATAAARDETLTVGQALYQADLEPVSVEADGALMDRCNDVNVNLVNAISGERVIEGRGELRLLPYPRY